MLSQIVEVVVVVQIFEQHSKMILIYWPLPLAEEEIIQIHHVQLLVVMVGVCWVRIPDQLDVRPAVVVLEED